MPQNEVEILLVEDDPRDVRLTVREVLSEIPNSRISVAGDGEEALDYLFCRGAHINQPPPDKSLSGDSMNAAQTKALRILYVEDNPRDAKLHTRLLKKAGYAVSADVVVNQEEFLSALRSKAFDIILADYHLPQWTGREALQALHREGVDIPFILVSGTIGEEEAVDCVSWGAADYVLKDRPTRLPLAVQRALEKRRAKEEQTRAERTRDFLAAIVECSEDAIIGMTRGGTIVSWNLGAVRTFGYWHDEILNQPFAVLLVPEGAQELEVSRDRLLQGKSVPRHETKGRKKTGETIDIVLTVSRVPEANGFAAVIARDITEQKRLQKELFLAQKMEAIGQLAAGVAHDFNNLLTLVTGYSQMILDGLSESDPLNEDVREIYKAGERAASLTRQLLAFSRKQILKPRVLDLNMIVAEMDRMLRRVIGEDVDLATVLDPELGSVEADPGQVEQVLMNLAVNARDAMPKGGKLSIETSNVDLTEASPGWQHIGVKSGPYVMLAVSDNGCGMDAGTQARIFEPFFTTKEPGHGTGLGLSTVYGIVEQSGGAIFVYSEPSQGTTFKIYLPRREAIPAANEVSMVLATPPGSEAILLVEDEDAVRKMVCQILQRQGYTVLCASNGNEAMALSEEHPDRIDLLITDVVMGGMSGSELSALLTARSPEIKTLFISGYTGNAIVHHGVLGHDAAFLQKPFDPQDFARKVRDVLDHS